MQDPVEERSAARRDVQRAAGKRTTPPLIGGWPWRIGLLIAVAFIAWLFYAVWFS